MTAEKILYEYSDQKNRGTLEVPLFLYLNRRDENPRGVHVKPSRQATAERSRHSDHNLSQIRYIIHYFTNDMINDKINDMINDSLN